MIQLPNDCSCSELAVFPKNWNEPGAKLELTWNINYRFYDPTVVDTSGEIIPKQVIIKGVNKYKTLAERRDAIKTLLTLERKMLLEEAYNPHTGKISDTQVFDISPGMPFVKALSEAHKRLRVGEYTKKDIKYVIAGVGLAAGSILPLGMPIGKIRRRHIKMLLEWCSTHNPKFSDKRYNKYRAYLRMLFKELVSCEAVETNPINDLETLSVEVEVREITTKGDRGRIQEYFAEHHPDYGRFLQIFFHSGLRITELFRVQRKHVDLVNQQVYVLVKKGRQKKWKWKWRPIKNKAIEFWQDLAQPREIMTLAGSEEQYIFSQGYIPGTVQLRYSAATRMWDRHVKKVLGIDADLYSLKHSNTDETAKIIGIKKAQKFNDQKSERTTRIYAVGEEGREMEELKEVNNTFS